LAYDVVPLGRNLVDVVTTTLAREAFRFTIVKVPVPPLVPQAPAAVEPFTDTTIPNADVGGKPGRAKIRTRVAFRPPPLVTAPCEPTIAYTHTLANDGDATSFIKNVVVGETLTSVVLPLRRSTVNDPEAPAVPHAPLAVAPFTEITMPNAVKSSGTVDQIITSVAAIAFPDRVPVAPTISSTHTFAKVGDDTTRDTNTVELSTLTTRRTALRFMIVKVPLPPSVPHAPSADEPLTETTMPNTETVGAGLGDQIRTLVAMKRPFRMRPVTPTNTSTHTLANVGELMLRDENRVSSVTWIVVRDVFRLTSRNVPLAPAVPHAPSADERLTATTTPYVFEVRGDFLALAGDTFTATSPITSTATAIARVVRNTAYLPVDARNNDATERVARAAALPQTAPSRK
jgi:hypothetical protein